MKTKKTKKSKKMRGRGMGTHGGGARKKRKGSGHRGGKGMSGSGKRADHKKTLVNKKHGHKYFGKQGITSRGTKRDIRNRINVGDIIMNIEKYKGKDGKIDLSDYKILGSGEVKTKLIIKAKEASKSAIEKVKKAGGEIILPEKKKVEEKAKEKIEKKVKESKIEEPKKEKSDE